MAYLFLATVVILCTVQNITQKQYSLKVKHQDSFMFGAFCSLFAMLFFLISSGFSLELSGDYVPYSIGFAVAYASTNIGLFYAVKLGPLSITLLASSYSLIIPTLYGVIFKNEKIGAVGYVGLVLLAVSIFMINMKTKKEREQQEKKKVSLPWLCAVAVMFVGNGMCSTLQAMQQEACGGAYKNEFMILALGIVFVALFVFSIILSRENVFAKIKEGIPYGIVKGVANGIVNLLVMVLTAMLPTAILFPTVSGGGLVLGFFIAVFYYKEKLNLPQIIGYAIGTVSVVLLNL